MTCVVCAYASPLGQLPPARSHKNHTDHSGLAAVTHHLWPLMMSTHPLGISASLLGFGKEVSPTRELLGTVVSVTEIHPVLPLRQNPAKKGAMVHHVLAVRGEEEMREQKRKEFCPASVARHGGWVRCGGAYVITCGPR